jgi:tRNA-specific 2-thiouridylase
LYSRTLIGKRANWIAIDDLREPMPVQAKIRHRHEPADAVIEKLANGDVQVTFDEPQRAITPGQAVVFYDRDVVVGGAWIA